MSSSVWATLRAPSPWWAWTSSTSERAAQSLTAPGALGDVLDQKTQLQHPLPQRHVAHIGVKDVVGCHKLTVFFMWEVGHGQRTAR